MTALQQHVRPEGTRVVFCGHSLGGAVAQLLALEWAHKTQSRSDLVTAGAPRAGNEAFQRLVAQRTRHVQVRVDGDIVCAATTALNAEYAPHRAEQHVVLGAPDGAGALAAADAEAPPTLWGLPFYAARARRSHDLEQYLDQLERLGPEVPALR